MRSPTGLDTHVLAQGCLLRRRGEPSPRGCRKQERSGTLRPRADLTISRSPTTHATTQKRSSSTWALTSATCRCCSPSCCRPTRCRRSCWSMSSGRRTPLRQARRTSTRSTCTRTAGPSGWSRHGAISRRPPTGVTCAVPSSRTGRRCCWLASICAARWRCAPCNSLTSAPARRTPRLTLYTYATHTRWTRDARATHMQRDCPSAGRRAQSHSD